MNAITTTWQPIIGVEVHVQLATRSKMFCACRVGYGEQPNTLTCAVCEGQPGALPIVNRRAVEYGIRIGLALGCTISRHTKFDRKNYFYPDLPKGYQISQYDQPLCFDGHLAIPVVDPSTGHPKNIRIERAHLEEDAGKSIHMEGCSLVDLNRAGTPLVEVVSRPDLRSSDEAWHYLTTLKRNLSYLGVSPLSMERGSLRCDINISLRAQGVAGLPPYKVEIKNLNSFSNARAVIEYEIARQQKLLEAGVRPLAETRLWDDERSETRAMRSKEGLNDYRYFPEPDLPPLRIDPAWVHEIRLSLPEMPDHRISRFLETHGIKVEDAEAIAESRELSDFFEACVERYPQPQVVANWIIGELGRAMNERSAHFVDLQLVPEQLVGVLELLDAGNLNNITAKEVFADMVANGGSALDSARRLDRLIEADDGAAVVVVEQVIVEFAKAVGEYRAGKTQTMGFLVGQCMRKLGGKGNPKLLATRIAARLKT